MGLACPFRPPLLRPLCDAERVNVISKYPSAAGINREVCLVLRPRELRHDDSRQMARTLPAAEGAAIDQHTRRGCPATDAVPDTHHASVLVRPPASAQALRRV